MRYKEEKGEDHPITLGTQMNLALCYSKLERYKEAESMYLECFELYERRLGHDHEDAIKCANNLAVLYGNLKDYPNSEHYYEFAFNKYAKLRGALDSVTLLVANNWDIVRREVYAIQEQIRKELLLAESKHEAKHDVKHDDDKHKLQDKKGHDDDDDDDAEVKIYRVNDDDSVREDDNIMSGTESELQSVADEKEDKNE